MAAFNRDDIEACTRYFAIPCTLVTTRGVQAITSREAFFKQWVGTHEALRKAGMARSVVTDCRVFALEANMAIASVRYDRFDAAGGLTEQISGTYSLAKHDDGWKIIAFLMHPRENWLGELK